MKKLSKQIATLTEKLDALQQSVANIPGHRTLQRRLYYRKPSLRRDSAIEVDG